MGTPHFFSDCVADLDGTTYPTTFDFDESARAAPAPSPSPSRPYPSTETVWLQPQYRQKSIEDTPQSSSQYLGPSLLAVDLVEASQELPGPSWSSNPSTRSTTRTSSSSNSVPTLRKSKSTSASTAPPPGPSPPLKRPSQPPQKLSPPPRESSSPEADAPSPREEAFPPPKRRKARKGKKEAAQEDEDEDGSKRDKFLERNRVAASKCRQKKKEYVSDLEEKKQALEGQHAQLQMEHTLLLGEVSRLKDQLMAHANCNDAKIDKWIENEARKFVQGASSQYGQMQPATYVQVADSRHPSMTMAAPDSSAYGDSKYDTSDPALRQENIPFAHASSFQTPPAIPSFAGFVSQPPTQQPNLSYDHMPESMFSSPPQNFR